MAILTGINTRLSGSAGDWTFAQVAGKTVAKQKVAPKATPVRTMPIMRRRVQWGNLVNLFRSFEGTLHPSFENRPDGVSDYNAFMQANIDTVPVYLTKDEARQGGSVVAAYQITRGSLPSVAVTEGTDYVVSSIGVGTGFVIDDDTTVKEFSDAVVNNNDGYHHGDQITFFLASQTVNAATQVPYVKIDAYEVTQDQTDNVTTLYSLVTHNGFEVSGGKLAIETGFNGAVAWVHSVRGQNGTRVSTQRFFVMNNLLPEYQTAAKLAEAVESYGGVRPEEFLTPNGD